MNTVWRPLKMCKTGPTTSHIPHGSHEAAGPVPVATRHLKLAHQDVSFVSVVIWHLNILDTWHALHQTYSRHRRYSETHVQQEGTATTPLLTPKRPSALTPFEPITQQVPWLLLFATGSEVFGRSFDSVNSDQLHQIKKEEGRKPKCTERSQPAASQKKRARQKPIWIDMILACFSSTSGIIRYIQVLEAKGMLHNGCPPWSLNSFWNNRGKVFADGRSGGDWWRHFPAYVIIFVDQSY